jgi:cytochrome c oxidase subunit II
MRVKHPFAILACVTAGLLAAPSRSNSTAVPQSAEPRVIEVIVKRYEFVPPSIEVTQGERVRLVVKSGDGLHGFGIKRFDVSKEIPRGATVNIDFSANATGEFPILCTEFCGDGHEQMKGLLVVKAREAVPDNGPKEP